MKNDYVNYVLEENRYLISMVPVEELLRFGWEIGLDENSRVLDLCCGDVTAYIPETLSLGKRFLKPGGLLAYQKLYAKTENPPQELIDFDGEVLSLSELNGIFNGLGYYITSMASDSTGMWEKYVFCWSGKRDLLQLVKNREDKVLESRIRKWHEMYFKYRRPYEGQALFGLERI